MSSPNEEVVAFLKDSSGTYVSVTCSGGQLGLRPGYTDWEIFDEELAHQLRDSECEVLDSNSMVEDIRALMGRDGKLQLWHELKFPVKNLRGDTFVGGYRNNITHLSGHIAIMN